MALADQLVQAKNNALNPTNTPLKTVYAGGADLANAKNTYGNTVNYGDINSPNLKAGDIVAGGSAVTPGITDSMINSAGASRLSGATANDTLGAMQTNSHTTLPQYYQNTNNNIAAGADYSKLTLNNDTSGYKNQLSDALNNSQYGNITSNTVGMDNTPYTGAINNSLNNANTNTTGYQNAIAGAMKQYGGNVPSFQDLANRLTTVKSTADYNQLKSDIQKYYPDQTNQFNDLVSQAKNGFKSSGSLGDTMSGLTSGMNTLASNTPTSTYNPNNPTSQADFEKKMNGLNGTVVNPTDQSAFETKMNGLNSPVTNPIDQTTYEANMNKLNSNTVNPQDSATFTKNMTDKINNLYNTQKNNVGLYYQTGIDQAKQQYAGLRNQASVTDQQNQNKLKESVAQQGLFNSGDNITAQTGINNQYANDLSGYNKQEQNYYDTTNNQIAQQKAGYDAQQAQAMIDLGYKSDTRDFSLANLQDTRNQNAFNNANTMDQRSFNAANLQNSENQNAFNNGMSLDNRNFNLASLQDSRNQNSFNNAMSLDNRSFQNANLLNNEKQQQFQNAMTGINSQYGMNQDQFNNTLKGTTTTYGMGRDNVSDAKYNNDSAMQADQINYGRSQDQFNNTLKTIAQQYGMDQDQVNNLLKYAQFNSSQDQRQFSNNMAANAANSGLTQQQTDNSYRQTQADNSNSQWNQQFNYNSSQDTVKNNQWQQQFDYQKQKDTIAQQLAAARASSGSGGSGGGRRSSGRSSGSSGSSSGSNLSQIDSYARDKSMDIGDRLRALDGLANDSSQDADTRRNADEYKQMLIMGMHYDNV